MIEALPRGIQITVLEITPKGKVTISGKTPSVEAASQKAMVAMEASPRLRNPRFLGSTQEQQGLTFRVSCELRSGGRRAGP